MPLEIEKKYTVYNHTTMLDYLDEQFGEGSLETKAGFWWCDNYPGHTLLQQTDRPSISTKVVAACNRIGDLSIPVEPFQYVRLRLVNNSIFRITFKTKQIINTIECNTEFEKEINETELIKILAYLKDTCYIFYHNVKSTWNFSHDQVNYQLSQLSDLKLSYLEVEVIGDDETTLFSRVKSAAVRFAQLNLKEELRNYAQLSRLENSEGQRHTTIAAYTQQALQAFTKEREKR